MNIKLGDKSGKYYDQNHAMTAATHWMQFANEHMLNSDIAKEVFECVLWHMGQWSGKKTKESYDCTLSSLKSAKIVHLCDYISSRKSIFDFEEE